MLYMYMSLPSVLKSAVDAISTSGYVACCSGVTSHIPTFVTHTFNIPFSRTTRVSRYQKGKTNLDFTQVRDSEWKSKGRMPFLPPTQ